MNSINLIISIVIVIIALTQAFTIQSNKFSGTSLRMSLSDYKQELAQTAALLAGPGML